MKKLTDIEIIDSVQKGNTNDYTLIIDRYKNKAFSLLVNILKNKMDAEEALQDSFIKAFNSLESFRRDAQFSTWFYKIVYNTGLTIISTKKRKIEMEMSSIDDLYFLKEDDAMIYSISENKKEYLLNMVDKLPIRNSLVLILFYIDNLSLIEISEVLDLSLVNCKVMLHRSRN
ncbi:MAG: sigma-70 family RNA polymerase sigma factor, partial [Ignavibacteriae bacterium]|nr:sigma-70 family RNA polymerase sigma factor [Ignavibacteriota bacterium]